MSTAKVITILHPSSAVNNIVNDASGNVAVGNNLTVAGTSTISGNETVTGTLVMGSSFKRNRIINGNMLIDQRNAGASVSSANGGYYVDRFVYSTNVNGKFTVGQNLNAVAPPAGFSKYLGFQSNSAYSVGASDYFAVGQQIEGLNVADLAWGTASAKTITLSFSVYSSLTGTFGGVIKNGGATRSYPFTYTISSANTWTNISVTVAGDTTGTWATDNTAGLIVYFGLGVGSTFSGTAGAWAAASYISATSAVSIVGNLNATFYITGVQLEVGTKATPYEMQIYSDQLAQCQRYYEYGFAQVGTQTPAGGNCYFGTTVFQVSKRTAPTISQTASYSANVNSTTFRYQAIGSFSYLLNASAAGVVEYDFNWTASAEL